MDIYRDIKQHFYILVSITVLKGISFLDAYVEEAQIHKSLSTFEFRSRHKRRNRICVTDYEKGTERGPSPGVSIMRSLTNTVSLIKRPG